MQRVSDGYTIIEVMIFLAVSAAILGSAINLISGRQATTEFDQKMRDTLTKVQSWMNDVSTGFTGGDPSSENCTLKSGRPVINNVAPPPGYLPSCVFLGKAIQFTDTTNLASQADTLYVYSIFGTRLDKNGELPTNLFDASPAAAVGPQGGQGATSTDLSETFSLAPAQVTSVKSTAVGSAYTSSHLIGFFSSFNTEQSTVQNGSTDVNVYQFHFDVNGPSAAPGDQPGGSAVRDCLSLITSSPCFPLGTDPTKWPESLTDLQVCLSDGRHTAQLTISSANGVRPSVKLDYVAC